MKDSTRDTMLTVRVETQLADELRKHADRLGKTPSGVVRDLLAAALVPSVKVQKREGVRP